MKRLLFLAVSFAFATAQAEDVTHFRWLVAEGEHAGAEIIYARSGEFFRGEYVDPGLQERCSVPIAGTIDDEGNLKGESTIRRGDKSYGKISGKISGGTFEVAWKPDPDAPSEPRTMNMQRKAFEFEAAQAQARHPGVFYNSLHLGLTPATSKNLPLGRVASIQYTGRAAPKEATFYVEHEATVAALKNIPQKILKDILALPEMKFKNAATLIDGEPTDAEPYYTVKGGSNMGDHFATSHWFRVYVAPEIEIRYYDLASDTEISLAELRGETPDGTILTFHAYVKLAAQQPEEGVGLLIDDVLWIRGDETEKLKRHGFDPANVDNDYVLYNAKEEWLSGATYEAKFTIVRYDAEGIPDPNVKVQAAEFIQHLKANSERGILAILTASREGKRYTVFSVKEVYVP